ncbi:MAG: urease accessory protein UreF [Planctomycetaceae bacterium]|nr:urease accessory protein UreF [Planctomycetaceae bacterium]
MRVLQFGDSVLPVGAFSFSGGLESAVQLGAVRDLASLREFVQTAAEQAASGDGIALLHAQRAARAGDLGRIRRIDQSVLNRKLNEETRTMTVRMGRKLAELAEHVIPSDVVASWLAAIRAGETPGSYPVAQALVFAALQLGERDAFAAHLYGVTSMMISASLRLMKISYLDAQSILFEVNSWAHAAYEQVAAAALEDMQTFAPLADIAAAAHLKAEIRMFMN